jgi:chemotaxis protein histidine kinase CheA
VADDGDRGFLLSIFLMEAWDTVGHLEDSLGRLREDPEAAAAALDPLLVVTHRLKGAAALHGCPGIAELAGATEPLLPGMARLRADERQCAIDFLAELVPELKRQLDRVAAGGGEDAAGLAAFRSRHPRFLAGRADGTPAASSAKAPTSSSISCRRPSSTLRA